MRKQQVRWTDAERDDLAERVANARLLHPETPLLSLINGQVAMLPGDRRRELKKLADDEQLVEKVRLRLALLREAARRGLQPPEKVYVEPEPADVVAKLSPAQLLLYLGQRVFGELELMRETLHRIEESLITLNAQHPPRETRDMRKRDRVRIALVGPLPAQFNEIEAAIGDAADLRFVDKDRAATRFPAADRVLLMRNFISHEWQERAYSQFDRDLVHLVAGGVSAMIQEIRRILVK